MVEFKANRAEEKVSYFTVALLNHGIILEDCLDGTDGCQPRKPRAYRRNGDLGWAREYRDFPMK